MKILKIIGIVVLSILVVAFIAVLVISPKAHMERSILVNAQPEVVFQQLASFENFNKWSPWVKMDPTAKQTVEGPAMGVGAKMSWDGPESGKGKQWTVEFQKNKRVKNAMEFEGMQGVVFAEFVLQEVPEGTKVTWAYDSDVTGTSFTNTSMTKLFNSFMLESLLGKNYEEGLSTLKQVAESQPAIQQEPVAADSTSVH